MKLKSWNDSPGMPITMTISIIPPLKTSLTALLELVSVFLMAKTAKAQMTSEMTLIFSEAIPAMLIILKNWKN